MKSRHSVGFYVVAPLVASAEVSAAPPRLKMLKKVTAFQGMATYRFKLFDVLTL
jgi:hypothetical protein